MPADSRQRGAHEARFEPPARFREIIGEAVESWTYLKFTYYKPAALRGLDITITTSARTDVEGRALLGAFKFPFRS